MVKLLITLLLIFVIENGEAQNKAGNNFEIKKVSAKDVRTMIDTSHGPMIVNFWASWCGPCVREIPWFDSIIVQKNTPVKLLLVSLDFKKDYPQKLNAFVKKQGYKGEVVFLNEMISAYYIPVIDPKWSGDIPASIFIDNEKKYYQLYNQQLPKEKFGIELDKLLN